MKIRFSLILAVSASLLTACQGTPERIDCGGIDIVVNDSLLLKKESVKETVVRNYGCCIGEMLDSLNLAEIEEIIDSLPVVKKSEAWTTRDGVLHINVFTHTPDLMFRQNGKNIFCDENGYMFVLSDCDSLEIKEIYGELPFVPINGDHGSLPESQDRIWLSGVLEIAKKDFDGKIRIVRNHELELIPDQGEEVFLFGQPDDIDSKFVRIERYYEKIRPLGKEYKIINLKYKGQTICRKDI